MDTSGCCPKSHVAFKAEAFPHRMRDKVAVAAKCLTHWQPLQVLQKCVHTTTLQKNVFVCYSGYDKANQRIVLIRTFIDFERHYELDTSSQRHACFLLRLLVWCYVRILWLMLGYVWPAPMPHSRTPCGETSTNAYSWATINMKNSQASKIKLVFQEGCSTYRPSVGCCVMGHCLWYWCLWKKHSSGEEQTLKY